MWAAARLTQIFHCVRPYVAILSPPSPVPGFAPSAGLFLQLVLQRADHPFAGAEFGAFADLGGHGAVAALGSWLALAKGVSARLHAGLVRLVLADLVLEYGALQ